MDKWGPHRSPAASSATKAARLVSIPLASMPQTFRDAVTVTRKLNIRYLWIDSLCIIQDSHADWEAEAARMADVYRNAHLTVAASHSSDSTGGCFSNAPRREETTTVCLPLKKEPRGLCCCLPSTHARKFRNHLFLVPSPQLTGGRSNGTAQRAPLPLETRAWTLQERVLSSRFLSFEQGQIAWSCAGMTCNTADSQGLVTEDPSSRVQRILSLSWWGSVLGRLGKPVDAASLAGAHDVWITLVEDYSRRRLTRESDRLIAIKGVADALGGATGDVYLAGLWRRWLTVAALRAVLVLGYGWSSGHIS
ncbi:het-domain-containing protein [Neofusicoccum parvum]|nr:het-domain-containing protein [Neofusicoccum parvum]